LTKGVGQPAACEGLILVPTRELAIQVVKDINKVTSCFSYPKILTVAAYGGRKIPASVRIPNS